MDLQVTKKLAIPMLAIAGFCAAAADPGLVEAVKTHNHDALAALIKAKTDANIGLPDGSTPLAWAAYYDDLVAVNALLAAGANPNTANIYAESPLTLACENGSQAIVQRLLDAGANGAAARLNGETALMLAARAGNAEIVKSLLDHGAKIDAAESEKGQNALMWASAQGNSAVVDILLKRGALANHATQGGFTPLVFAIQNGDVKTVQSLLAAGANPNLLVSGTSMLALAMTAGKMEIAASLVEKGADPKSAGAGGMTPLHQSARAGNAGLVKLLLQKGADPNAKTAKAAAAGGRGRGGGGGGGRGAGAPAAGELTPLLMAARAGVLEIMKTLIAGGADPSLKADDDSTLLIEAAGSGKREVVEYVWQFDKDIKAANKTGTTVLHSAVSATSSSVTQPELCETIQFLAEKGAPLDSKDSRGRTPLAIAEGPPLEKAVDLLTKLLQKSARTP